MKNSCAFLFLIVVAFTASVYAQQAYDYEQVLGLSMWFYEAQRCGILPNTNRVNWRWDSFVDDGSDVNLDLEGGYFDAGDHVKFGFPLAGSISILAWGMLDYRDGYLAAGEYENGLDMLRWGLDYMEKTHPEPNVIWVNVGNGTVDHSFWGRPEEWPENLSRPSVGPINITHPGSDLAGEYAAAFASSSLVFRNVNNTYSKVLLRHAIECYDFAFNYRGRYSDNVYKDCMDHWPAIKAWKQGDYLASIAGERTVPIEIGSHYTNENWSQDLVKFKDFLNRQITTAEPCDRVEYLAQHNLFEQIPALRKDILIPEYCCVGTLNESVDIKAWLGPQGTISPMHYDPKHNLLCQVFGHKKIILAAPDDTPNLYPHETEMLKNTSQIDAEHIDAGKFPMCSAVKFFHLNLYEGEMLYIPPRWWHYVRSLEKSFSVSFWWENIMVLLESVVSGHQFTKIRERLGDKIEMMRFDPYIQKMSLYRERKKVRSM